MVLSGVALGIFYLIFFLHIIVSYFVFLSFSFVCVCVYTCFFVLFLCFLFIWFGFICPFIFKIEKKKAWSWKGGEDLGGDKVGETMTRV